MRHGKAVSHQKIPSACDPRPGEKRPPQRAAFKVILKPKESGLLLLHIKIAPIFTPHLTICAPVLAPFLTTSTPVLTPLHADGLGLSV
jgi:hypothetical protein